MKTAALCCSQYAHKYAQNHITHKLKSTQILELELATQWAERETGWSGLENAVGSGHRFQVSLRSISSSVTQKIIQCRSIQPVTSRLDAFALQKLNWLNILNVMERNYHSVQANNLGKGRQKKMDLWCSVIYTCKQLSAANTKTLSTFRAVLFFFLNKINMHCDVSGETRNSILITQSPGQVGRPYNLLRMISHKNNFNQMSTVR